MGDTVGAREPALVPLQPVLLRTACVPADDDKVSGVALEAVPGNIFRARSIVRGRRTAGAATEPRTAQSEGWFPALAGHPVGPRRARPGRRRGRRGVRVVVPRRQRIDHDDLAGTGEQASRPGWTGCAPTCTSGCSTAPTPASTTPRSSRSCGRCTPSPRTAPVLRVLITTIGTTAPPNRRTPGPTTTPTTGRTTGPTPGRTPAAPLRIRPTRLTASAESARPLHGSPAAARPWRGCAGGTRPGARSPCRPRRAARCRPGRARTPGPPGGIDARPSGRS